MRFLLNNTNASGPFNLTAPNPISNAEFMRTAARALQRPYWLPAPAFALRLVLGEMATLVLDGLYLHPERLQKLGFSFQFDSLESALGNLLKKQ